MTAPAKRSTPRAPTTASAAVVTVVPKLGKPWAGGRFAGRLGAYLLIVGPQRRDAADWSTAMSWAAELQERSGVYRDWSLPTTGELAHLYGVLPRLFRPEPYWSCEEQLDLASDALVIHFGAQSLLSHWGKVHACRAVAVRRVLV